MRVVVEYLTDGLLRVHREGHPTLEAIEANCRFEGAMPVLDVSIPLAERVAEEHEAPATKGSGFDYLDSKKG